MEKATCSLSSELSHLRLQNSDSFAVIIGEKARV